MIALWCSIIKNTYIYNYSMHLIDLWSISLGVSFRLLSFVWLHLRLASETTTSAAWDPLPLSFFWGKPEYEALVWHYTICFDEDLRKDLHTASSELLKKWSKLKQNVQILSSYSLSMSKSGLSGKSWLSMTNSLSLLLRRWFLGFDLGCDWLRIHGRHRLWDCGKPFAVLPHGTCAQQLPSALWTFVISNGKIPP